MRKLSALTTILMVLALASTAAAPSVQVLSQRLAKPVAQQAVQTIVLQSRFGDTNTTYDGDGSVDDFMTYNPPHDFITWATNTIRPTVPLRNADITLQSQAKFPFILTRHSSFDPLKVISATLRVDFLFSAVPSEPASDTIRFWDERDTTGNYTVGYQFGVRIGHRFCSPFTPACTAEDFPPTWISLDLNLKDGTARVFDLNPITHERTPFSPRPKGAASGCNAQVPVDCPWPFPPLLRDSFPRERGSPADVLRLAADGTLYGMLEDDSALSYVSLEVEVPGVEVPVDIKPEACPNPLNTNSQGILPVAILGTATFDVTQVDPTSIKLEGVSPLRSDLEDVATPFVPFTGKQEATDCSGAGPDGFVDLTLKFDNPAVVAALGTVEDGEVRVLKLAGNLTDGTSIVGEDVVVIHKK